jgi:photosystem II stability/assembly factor-like uncharacterized protein
MPVRAIFRSSVMVGVAAFLFSLVFSTGGLLVAEAGRQETNTVEWQNLGLYGARVKSMVWGPDGETVYTCNWGVNSVYKASIDDNLWESLPGTIWSCGSIAFDNQRGLMYLAAQGWGWVERSADGGNTWDRPSFYISPEDEYGPIHLPTLILVDPLTPTHILFTTIGQQKGVRYTMDDGLTWEWALFSPDDSEQKTFLDGDPNMISMDPTDPSYVYVSVGPRHPWSNDRGIYRSSDGGVTFQRVFTETSGRALGVAVSPLGTVFAAADEKLHRSWDKGLTWTTTNYLDYGFENISFHPVQSKTVWAESLRSDDEGETWTWEGHSFKPPLVHPDLTDLYYRGTSYGVTKSTDGGKTWTDVNQGLQEVGVQRIVTDPSNPDRIFVSADGGIGKCEDGGETWSYPILIASFGGSSGDIVFDPINPSIIYTTDPGEVFKSTDGGETWTVSVLDVDGMIEYLVLDPSNTQIGYLGMAAAGLPTRPHYGGVYKTEDGGVTWSSTALHNIPIRTVLWVNDNQTLYAGAINGWDDRTMGGVYLSMDKGASWERSGLDGLDVYVLAVDPRDPLSFYANTGMGFYRTKNGGESWELLIENDRNYMIPGGIAIDPNNPDTVFALVVYRLFASYDAGDTWQLYYENPEAGERRPEAIHIPWLTEQVVGAAKTAGSQPSRILMGTNQGLYAREIRFEYKTYIPILAR